MKRARKVIVSGGAGFIGSHLTERLVIMGWDVIVIDNFSTSTNKNLKGLKSKIKIVRVDISDYDRLYTALKKEKNVEFIFHLAALPRIERSTDNPVETHKSNVDGVFNMLQIGRVLGIKKFIFSSSSSVYGSQKVQPLKENVLPNPQNLYATQKFIGEQYCEAFSKTFNLPVLIFRLFNVYGPRMKGEGAYQLVFTKWIEQLEKGEPLTVFGDGKQTRDFTHISDVVDALVKGLEFEQQHLLEIINVGSGRQVSVNELASFFKHTVIHVEGRKFEERFKQADIKKAKRLLSWKPTVHIKEGVQELLR